MIPTLHHNHNTMLDINFIRANETAVRTAIVQKKKSIDLDALLLLDDERKKLQHTIDSLKNQQKIAGSNRDMETAQSLKSEIATLQGRYDEVVEKLQMMMTNVPNVIHDSVPFGKDEDENVVVKKV